MIIYIVIGMNECVFDMFVVEVLVNEMDVVVGLDICIVFGSEVIVYVVGGIVYEW